MLSFLCRGAFSARVSRESPRKRPLRGPRRKARLGRVAETGLMETAVVPYPQPPGRGPGRGRGGKQRAGAQLLREGVLRQSHCWGAGQRAGARERAAHSWRVADRPWAIPVVADVALQCGEMPGGGKEGQASRRWPARDRKCVRPRRAERKSPVRRNGRSRQGAGAVLGLGGDREPSSAPAPGQAGAAKCSGGDGR